MMITERSQVWDNLFNQGLKDVKNKEDNHLWKSSENEEQETILKVGLQ